MLATPWRLLSRCSMRSTHSKIVSLNSRGGMAKDAVEIGLFIRNMEYATLVPTGKVCGSACVYIWAAGKPRTWSIKRNDCRRNDLCALSNRQRTLTEERM